ncbi:MAG: hypothetical protein ABI584_00505 [Acidobacteriota bacterium]
MIEANACFRSTGPPRKTLERMYEEFHRSLDSLPNVRYVSKGQRLRVRYMSRVCPAEVALRFGVPSLEVFTLVLREFAGLLPGVLKDQKILGKRVDFPSLERALDASLGQTPATDAELQAFATRLREDARAAFAELSPWERLGINWSDYHPRARLLLDDPFFWQEADDYAPHGNDTGSDLLGAFRVWRRRNGGVPVLRFLSDLLRDWGFEERVAAFSEKAPAAWTKDDEMAVTLFDEANIALAFAQIKLEAVCDSGACDAALASIGRQLSPEVAAHFEWKTPLERVRRLEQMRAVLTMLGDA